MSEMENVRCMHCVVTLKGLKSNWKSIFLNVNPFFFFFLMSSVFQHVLLPVNFFRDEPSQLQRCYCERTKKRTTVFGLFVHSAGVQPWRKQPEVRRTGRPPFWFSGSLSALGIHGWSWENKRVWILINNLLILISLCSPVSVVVDLP